jgi:hypothetical protein
MEKIMSTANDTAKVAEINEAFVEDELTVNELVHIAGGSWGTPEA